jgi:hypothetical protein
MMEPNPMPKIARRLLVSTLLAFAAACGSSKPAGTGTGGKDGSGSAGSGSAAGQAGGSAGQSGSNGSAGAASSDAASDGTGAARSDAGTNNDGGPSEGGTLIDARTTSGAISATTGGTLTFAGGAFAVQSGALATDTTISIMTYAPLLGTPELETILDGIVDIQPDAMTFMVGKPALLALEVGALPAGKRAVVSVIFGAGWNDLPTSVANGKAYASVTQLARYAVRAVDDVACGATFTEDVACGTGTLPLAWTVAGFCNANLDANEFPATDKLLAACADMGASTAVTGGEMDFNDDLTYASNLLPPQKATLTLMLSAACTNAATSCAAVANQIVSGGTSFVDASCTGTPTAGCLCTGVYRPPLLATTATGKYTASGGKIALLGYPQAPARSYCVNSQTTPQRLYYSWGTVNGAGSGQFGFVLTKKILN